MENFFMTFSTEIAIASSLAVIGWVGTSIAKLRRSIREEFKTQNEVLKSIQHGIELQNATADQRLDLLKSINETQTQALADHVLIIERLTNLKEASQK